MRITLIGVAAFLAACATAGGLFAAQLEWSSLSPFPHPAGTEGAFVAVIDGRLVVAGGIERAVDTDGVSAARSEAWMLDSPEGDWRPTTPLPEPTAFGTAAPSGDHAVFVGGAAGGDSTHRTTAYRVRLEDTDLVYEALPPLPEPTGLASGTVLNGVVHVVGGIRDSDSGELTSDVLRLDLGSPEFGWEAAPSVPGPPRHSAGLAVQDGFLWLIGGMAASSGGDGSGELKALPDVYRFSPALGWTQVTDRPAPATGRAVPLGPTHIASIGGDRDGKVRTLSYHTVTDTWVSLGETPLALAEATVVQWDDALVAVGRASSAGESTSPVFAARLVAAPSGFSGLDYSTLTAYFAVLVLMGIYFARKASTTDDFFLAGGRMPWWATGLSIFGTQLSSISFMAVPAKVYATDWVYFLLQMTIVMIAFPVVFFYLPYFRRKKMTSAYEYLESRFNLPVRLYASVSFVLYQLGRMAIVLFLPAIALSTVTGISVYTCILVMGVLSTLYTVMGGMRAVIWTDVVQVFVLYGGALLSLAILLVSTDGGLSGIVSAGMEYDKFHMFNWTWDWTTTAVWVVVVGNLFMNLVPYTSDQAVVQRYFTTRDEKTAARSIWTNAILIVPSTLTLFLLGTGLWAFYRENPALLDPSLPTDSIFPLFIAQQLPAGIAGLLIAAVFAASMSTLDSSLNSVSAALVTDFFVRFRPESSDGSRLALARWLTAILGILATATSIALATFDIGSLWDTFQGMMGLLGGGLAGLFALGIFFRSANGRGAMVGAVSSVLILYWVQQHSDLHFFLYGAVGVLSCVLIGLASSQVLRAAQ